LTADPQFAHAALRDYHTRNPQAAADGAHAP
jgi:hypothetical protein